MKLNIKLDELDALILVEQKLKGLQEVILAIAEAPISFEAAPLFLYHSLDDITEDMSEVLNVLMNRMKE